MGFNKMEKKVCIELLRDLRRELKQINKINKEILKTLTGDEK